MIDPAPPNGLTRDELAALPGRTLRRDDRADAHRWDAYHRFLSLEPGVDRPLALHWLLFAELPPETRADGHAAVMPPFPALPYPRRMWAGGELHWRAPIAREQSLTRTTRIARADPKHGGSGDFLLAALDHDIRDAAGATLIAERQDIVFLPAATAAPATPATPLAFAPDWTQERRFGPVDLFRYSALTLNGHRIHYDRDYAQAVEHYPGLVVHGPLLATVLMQAAQRRTPDRAPRRFAYRALAPVFDGATIRLVGRVAGDTHDLAIVDDRDMVHLTATMQL